MDYDGGEWWVAMSMKCSWGPVKLSTFSTHMDLDYSLSSKSPQSPQEVIDGNDVGIDATEAYNVQLLARHTLCLVMTTREQQMH